MKALTVRQPWASAIFELGKDIENRSWSTRHRGPLAIHAALVPAGAFDWIAASSIWQETQLQPSGDWQEIEAQFEAFDKRAAAKLGVVLGTVDVVDCVRDQDATNYWAEPDMWHWVLANPQPFNEPVRTKGRLGLWEFQQ